MSSSNPRSAIVAILGRWRALTVRTRWSIATTCLVIAIAFIAARPNGIAFWASDPHWERIQSRGTLRVGMDASYPPFEWLEGDAFFGLDVELAHEIGDLWGVEIEFVVTHFDGLYDAMLADRCDLIISALPYDETMTQDLLYSDSYFNAGQVALVNAASGYATPAELQGQTVAVELGAEGHQLARQLTRDEGWDLVTAPHRELEQALASLVEGQAQALICDRVDAYALRSAHPQLALLDPPLTDAPYVVACPIDAPQLCAEVNTALQTLSDDGRLETITARWLNAGRGN